jgi:hypothetical protein
LHQLRMQAFVGGRWIANVGIDLLLKADPEVRAKAVTQL